MTDTESEPALSSDENGSEDSCDDSEEGSSGEESSFDEMSVGVALELPKRATRGKKYSKLVGEELEKDNQFWGHDTWAEEAIDEDYNCSEGEEQYIDSADSDFDESEDSGSDENEQEVAAEQRHKHKGAYVDPALLRDKKTRAIINKHRSGKLYTKPLVKKPKEPRPRVLVEFDRQRRDTTRLKTEEVARIEKLRTTKVKKRRKSTSKKSVKILSHEELMAQALRIEEQNTKSLQRLQAWEDERKRCPDTKKQTYKGHYDIWICWNSLLSIVTTNTTTGEEIVQTVDPQVVPEKPLELYMFTSGKVPEYYNEMAAQKAALENRSVPKCAVSGLHARYLDPVTGLHYHDSKAFKAIRLKHSELQCRLWRRGLSIVESKILSLRKQLVG